MEQYKHLDVKKVGVVTVANFRAQKILDDLVIQQVGEELYRLADSEPGIKLLVNFKGVAFLSSSVLGKLISLNKKCKANQGKLKFCEMDPKIYELFTITGLNKLFSIHKDELTALQDFY
jgi:anti-sigma B factor antagonist